MMQEQKAGGREDVRRTTIRSSDDRWGNVGRYGLVHRTWRMLVMNRLRLSAISVMLVFGLIGLPASLSAVEPDVSAPPESQSMGSLIQFHQRLFTLDSHIDVPASFATREVDPSEDGVAQVDFPKMERGGLDLAFFSLAVGQRLRTEANYGLAYEEAVAKLAGVERMQARYPDRIAIARTPREAERYHAEGLLIAAMGIENGFAIGKDISRLLEFRNRGVSYVSLVHLGHNDIADSANPVEALGDRPEEHAGLSEFGRAVIAEMNRVGLMVDVSHASKAAMLEALDVSNAPVIASHSGVRAFVDTERNMDDEQLMALKRNGGVIQVIGYSPYLRANSDQRNAAIAKAAQAAGLETHMDWTNATNEDYLRFGELLHEVDRHHPRASVSEFIDQIDYVVRLIGVDYVGIGSDFYAGGHAAVGGLDGWMNAAESWRITRELVARGYSPSDIAKIWGGNLLRVWAQVVEAAEPD